MFQIERTTILHIAKLIKDMRDEEIAEIWASHGVRPEDIILYLTESSRDVSTVLYKGKVLCITGIVPFSLISDVASPWLLTTNEMKKYPRILLKGTKFFLDKWKKEYRILENQVDARYTASLRWAKWAGFTIYDAEPYGYLQLPFHRIQIRRD